MRIVLIGEHAWQVRMAGEGWLRSIHHPDATFIPIDSELLNDARRLTEYFGLRTIGVDYILAPDGGRYLLEVNHVPNVTVFPEVRQAYSVRGPLTKTLTNRQGRRLHCVWNHAVLHVWFLPGALPAAFRACL